VLTGHVTPDGEPVVLLAVAGQLWPAVIDTAFNGDLELPDNLRPFVNPRLWGHVHSLLAAGQSLVEEVYTIDFPFDGQTVEAEATFVPGGQILIGTHLIRHYRLTVDFPARTVLLERVAGP
jgi:predicted aspartyl protease